MKNQISENNKILDTFSKNITVLDINNTNFTGVLDLNKFTNLKELYCQNNNITEIINVRRSLEIVDISNNDISYFGPIVISQDLQFENNPLISLYYSLEKQITNIPKTLKYLYFRQYNLPLIITNSIEYLSVENNFNSKITFLPNSKLKTLRLGENYNLPLLNLPNSLQHLKFTSESDYNHPLNNLSMGLICLQLGKWFNHTLDYLPNSITHLYLNSNYNNDITNIPNSITHLSIGIKINNSIKHLTSITHLEIYARNNYFDNNFNNNFNNNFDNNFDNNLPNSITHLSIYGLMNIKTLPNTIREIMICNIEQYDLTDHKYQHLINKILCMSTNRYEYVCIPITVKKLLFIKNSWWQYKQLNYSHSIEYGENDKINEHIAYWKIL